MAFAVIQAGTSLQLLNQNNELITLTLPTGITLDSAKQPRFAVFERYVVMVNSPSRPITIDNAGLVRVLCPLNPTSVLVLDDDGGAGALTGAYKAVQTFVLRDVEGNTIAESGPGPVMDTAFTAAADTLNAENLSVSADAIWGSKIYRTTAGGAVYFAWIEQNGNLGTNTVSDDRTDESLGSFAIASLGAPPNLSHIGEFRTRLWGVIKATPDIVAYTEAGTQYAWPVTNRLPVPPAGADLKGVTAIIPRRDALGLVRLDSFHQVTGTSNTDFRVVKIAGNVGCVSQESVAIYRDVAYWLGLDGVYQWGAEGIKCISDGAVRSWFTTDTYFERSRFANSFGFVDPIQNKYVLFLAQPTSGSEDRWVEFDLSDKTWWGPHLTSAFTPRCAIVLPDSSDRYMPLIGSTSGFLWKQQATKTDDAAGDAAGISLSVDTKFHDNGTPDIDKYWGRLAMLGKVQAAGTMTITPKTGYLNASASAAISYTMTLGRQILRRLGLGKLMQLNFAHSTVAQDVEIYGYEVDDVHELGRR